MATPEDHHEDHHDQQDHRDPHDPLGVIGLGAMGLGMALRLLDTGHAVVVHNRSADRCEAAIQQGATAAESVTEAARTCRTLVVMVADDEATSRMLLGPRGLIAAPGCCTTVIDASTVLPATSRRIAAALGERGIAYLDAPVAGGPAQARQGELLFLIGGEAEAVARCRPILEALGRGHVRLGGHGTGSCAKLGCNLMGLVNLLGLSAAMLLAEAGGIAVERFLEVANESGGRSAVSLSAGANMAAGRWESRFALHLAAKDARLAAQLAGAGHEQGELAGLVARQYAQAAAQYGSLDVTAIHRFHRERAGLDHASAAQGGKRHE